MPYLRGHAEPHPGQVDVAWAGGLFPRPGGALQYGRGRAEPHPVQVDVAGAGQCVAVPARRLVNADHRPPPSPAGWWWRRAARISRQTRYTRLFTIPAKTP